MYDETRTAVKKALELGKILFSLGPIRYEKLVKATSKIPSPSKSEIDKLKEQGLDFNEAIASWFSKAYSKAAVDAGFRKEHGLAMLAYAALLKDLKS